MTAPRIVDLHSELAGLSADDHAQYLLLAGRAGGQTAYGGTALANDLDLFPNTQSVPPQNFATDGFMNVHGRILFLGFSDMTAPPGINYQLMAHNETCDCSAQASVIPQGFWYTPRFDFNTLQTFGGSATFQDGSIWKESAAMVGSHGTFSLGSFLGGPRYQIGHAGIGNPPSGIYGYNSTPAADLIGGTSLTMPVMAGYTTNFPFPLQAFLALEPLRNGVVCTRYSHFKAYSAIANSLTLQGGSTITTEVGLDLQNLARGTTAISIFSDALGAYMDHAGLITYTLDVLRLGTTASTSHGLGAGDVLIGADLEVNGSTYFDEDVYFTLGGTSLNVFFVTAGSIFGGFTGVSDDGIHLFVRDQEGLANNHLILCTQTFRARDYDHDTLSAQPTLIAHSSLDPNTDNGEYLSFSYLGLQAGTMETDRAKFDLTLRAVSALPGASTNQDGGIINLVPGKNALGGGTDGVVRIWHSDEGGTDYLEAYHNDSHGLFNVGTGNLRFAFAGTQYYGISTLAVFPIVTNLRDFGATGNVWRGGYFGENANSGIYFGLSQTSRIWYDQSGTDTLQLNGTKQFVVNTGIMTRLTSGACVESGDAIYFGDPAVNGTWRIVRSGNDFAFERREAGTYVEKGAFTAV
jgi:hypothetical protein